MSDIGSWQFYHSADVKQFFSLAKTALSELNQIEQEHNMEPRNLMLQLKTMSSTGAISVHIIM